MREGKHETNEYPPFPNEECAGQQHVYMAAVGKMERRKGNITQLGTGPGHAWDSKVKRKATVDCLGGLYGLSTFMNATTRTFLSRRGGEKYGYKVEWYEEIQQMLDGLAGMGTEAEVMRNMFGTYTSRSYVYNAPSTDHRDAFDCMFGFCGIATLGDYKGGDMILPGLNVRMIGSPG